MKRFLQLIILSVAIGLLCLFLSQKFTAKNQSGTGKIYVYNWGEYIDPKLIKNFQKETGIKVVYETFDSNEAMEAKFVMVVPTMMLLFPANIQYKK